MARAQTSSVHEESKESAPTRLDIHSLQESSSQIIHTQNNAFTSTSKKRPLKNLNLFKDNFAADTNAVKQYNFAVVDSQHDILGNHVTRLLNEGAFVRLNKEDEKKNNQQHKVKIGRGQSPTSSRWLNCVC
jgi:hypothetical protein